MTRLLLALLLPGCASSTLLDGSYDGGPAFELSGPVDPAMRVEGQAVGAVVWVWIRGGNMGGEVGPAALEERLFRYGLAIPPPLWGGAPTGEAPPAWQDEDLLLGIPVLLDQRTPEEPFPAIAPVEVLRWLEQPAGAPVGLPFAAWTADHMLVARDAASPNQRLGQVPGWSGPCSLEDAARGFTLYRLDHSDCGGWRPLAEPGERTAFQGIEMVAIP